MKILHVISNLTPRSGGPTTVVRTLAAYQVRARLDVTVCTTNWGCSAGGKMPMTIDVLEDGVTYKYFASWSPLMFSLAMGRWFGSHMSQFDIVHIHGLYRFPVTFAAWRARRVGMPYLISPHGSLDPFLYKQSRYNLPLKRIYERLFDIPNLNNAAAIHYTTREEAKRVSFLRLRAKPLIVPNGIDWESFKLLPQKGSFRRCLGLNEKTPLLLFLGRINFKKGLDLLVPAFALVALKYPGARLAVVGPDNEGFVSKVRRWCVEQGIKDKVFFMDYIGSEKVKEAYVDADVFILPSYTENFGMAVVEAMACGCPVIISDQVNIWREVQETEAGVVARLNPHALAKSLCRVLDDIGAAQDIGARGRAVAEKRFAWPPIVDQMTQVYRGLIEKKTIGDWQQSRCS